MTGAPPHAPIGPVLRRYLPFQIPGWPLLAGAAPHGPIGGNGVAETALDPEGWVRIGPRRWRARRAPGAGAIAVGAPVRVLRLRGHELEVEPDADEAS